MSILNTYAKFCDVDQIHDNSVMINTKILSSFYGLWNLDFFRMMYDPFCLHQNISILQILCLEYATAMYPLCLICVAYLLMKLHDRFRVVQHFWKPAEWLIVHINKKWNTSNSLIETFGTFVLLSYVKIINTSFDLLVPVQLYNMSGKQLDCICTTMVHLETTIFLMLCWQSLCLSHSTLCHCYCSVSILVDAFSPVSTVAD